ncbi:MAG: ribonuclease Z [Ruminococcus sp.]|nr:ribonuclease Z [Ruminococcus sp.]
MPEICLLGTGGMMSLKNRWLTSLYYEYEGNALLIDCGEGTQIALAECGAKISRINMLLITHTHADHVSGLPGFLLSLGNASRTEPLEIYLPEGKVQIIKNLMSICDRLPFEVIFRELPIRERRSFTAEAVSPLVTIESLPVRHSTTCLGYSVTLTRKPEFRPERAKELEIPVQFWRFLHSGETVTLDDGRVITPDMVTLDNRPPIKVTYVTDTLPFAEIADFAKDSRLFVCEGMYGDLDKKESMNEKGHMLMQDACRLAAQAGAERLWLTHYSPAEMQPKRFAGELEKLFPNVTVTSDGAKITIKE